MSGGRLFAWVAVRAELWHCHPCSIVTGAPGGDVPLPGAQAAPSQCLPANCSVWLPPHRLGLLTRYHQVFFDKMSHSCTEMTTSPLPLEHPPFFAKGLQSRSPEEEQERDTLQWCFPAEVKLFWTGITESALASSSEDKVFHQVKLWSGSSALSHSFMCKASSINC